LDKGKSYYRGRSHRPRVGNGEKSAEAIVVPLRRDEGLNVKQLQISHGGLNAGVYQPPISATGKSKGQQIKDLLKMKEDVCKLLRAY
jgi:hypothetical protein